MTNEAGRKMWVIAVAILMWNLAGSTGLGRNLSFALGGNLGLASTAQAAPQVDPTGSNFAIWGSPSFNRQIGPDDEIVEVAAGYYHTVALLTDGSVACWGRNNSGQCTVPSDIGTPENPVASVAAGEYLFE
jgi:alpha-tubulin suppressor-like RCC1 family protein